MANTKLTATPPLPASIPIPAPEAGAAKDLTQQPEAGATKPARVPAKLTSVSSAVAIPDVLKTRAGGANSRYPFDSLEIGQTFGVLNKTAKNMGSVVFDANKRHKKDKLDGQGMPIFKTITLPDGTTRQSSEREQEPGRVFVAWDVDPKTDPDGASVRIGRKA